jgi:hypothetical protein
MKQLDEVDMRMTISEDSQFMGGCERSFAGRLWKTLGFLVFKGKNQPKPIRFGLKFLKIKIFNLVRFLIQTELKYKHP